MPVKFSISGAHYEDIVAEGYPESQQIDCGGLTPIEDDATPIQSKRGLGYNPNQGIYTYLWETDRGWDGTCRRFVVRLDDGTDLVFYPETDHVLYFGFR